MNPRTIAALALLMAGAGAVSLAGAAPVQDATDSEEGIEWRTDLDAARTEAKEKGLPMFVVFR